jgi:hypothetical protein
LYKRKCKLAFRDIFYYLIYLVSNNKNSATTITDHIKINNYCNAAKDAYIKKRSTIPSQVFDEIFNDLLKYFYTNLQPKTYKHKRILCIDGTYVPLSILMAENGYSATKNEAYCNALISGLYDKSNNIILDLSLCKHKDEREAVNNHMSYFKKGDIIIMDRGYYSEELLFKLNKLGVKVVFRLKKNSTMLTNLNDKKDVTIELENSEEKIKFRLLKYTIFVDDVPKIFYIGTTLPQYFTFNKIKNLYKDRWSIEEYFKCAKMYQSLDSFHSKKENLIKQEIHIHKCIMIITKILQDCYLKNLGTRLFNESLFKINLKNFIDKIPILIGKIIYKYDKKKDIIIMKIFKIILILCDSLTKIVNNRSFKRIRIVPGSMWYQKSHKTTSNSKNDKNSQKCV